MYRSGACSSPSRFEAASTAMAFGAPVAHRFVPSSGSTAMSTCGNPGGRRAAHRVRHADLLADVEHRRLVALAFADDDAAVDRHGVHDAAHRLDGDLIRPLAVALAHGVGARDRSLFDDAEKLEREI